MISPLASLDACSPSFSSFFLSSRASFLSSPSCALSSPLCRLSKSFSPKHEATEERPTGCHRAETGEERPTGCHRAEMGEGRPTCCRDAERPIGRFHDATSYFLAVKAIARPSGCRGGCVCSRRWKGAAARHCRGGYAYAPQEEMARCSYDVCAHARREQRLLYRHDDVKVR